MRGGGSLNNNEIVYSVLKELKKIGGKLSFEEKKFIEGVENGKPINTN
jgi:hypothetical protein